MAVAVTVCTGLRRVSETSATMTGVAAALIRVPGPHRRETTYDATTAAALAMRRVGNEIPPGRTSRRPPCLGSGDATP